MPNDDLNQAIEFIQQGRDEQAQPILQALIQANPQDLAAWSWYVKSCRTPEKRLKALESCLRFNPGNPQITEAIQKLREKVSAQPTPAFSVPIESSSLAVNPEPYDAYAALALPEAVNDIKAMDKLAPDEPARFMGLDENLGRPFIWYDVWIKALTQPKVDTYDALVRDPLASPGRAYWWVILAGLMAGVFTLISAISLVNDPSFTDPSVIEAFRPLGLNAASLENLRTMLAGGYVVLIPFEVIFNLLGLLFVAAIYNLLAKIFGGSGNFSRTVYLMGAYTAPLSIVTGILSIIPNLGSCLAALLGFYSFWLSVTALQAAHRLNGGRATMIVLIPSLLFLMIFCIAIVWLPQALLDAARHR
jgi:hypothetical protein